MTVQIHAAASWAQAAANMMQTLSRLSMPGWAARGVAVAKTVVKKLGPYAAIEILLPGGTLIAVGLWLYRSYRKRKGAGVPMTLVAMPSA